MDVKYAIVYNTQYAYTALVMDGLWDAIAASGLHGGSANARARMLPAQLVIATTINPANGSQSTAALSALWTAPFVLHARW